MPLKQKQTFTADILNHTYEFRHDPGVSNNLWIIRRLNQPANELLDERHVIFPKRRMTQQEMVAWYTDQRSISMSIIAAAEAADRANFDE